VIPNFDFHSNVISHDRLLWKTTNGKFVVYVMILNLLNDVHELGLDLLHQFQGKTFFNQTKSQYPIKTWFSYVRRRSLSPFRPLSPVRSLSPVRPLLSPLSTDSSLQKLREDTLIQRYNDLYARERLNAMDILRSVSSDYDMNRRICYRVIQVIKFGIFVLFLIDYKNFRKHFE